MFAFHQLANPVVWPFFGIKKKISVLVQSYLKNHIDARVQFLDEPYWRFTRFYGGLDASKRKRTWALLKHLAQQAHLPWLVMGDYNEVISAADKKGRVEVPQWRLRNIREALSFSRLSEIDYEGYQFTWSNRQPDEFHTEERLDRATATDS